jgi:NAD(P)H-hydrate epimerase
VKNEISWADIIAVGPGLGRDPQTSEAVINLLKNHESKRFVIDADAIFAIKNKQYKKVNLRENVLTPHHKEFADLLGIELSELKANLLYYGRKFSSETGSFLVLKGAPSIIFNPDGEVFINSSGNAGLAKFGSGDVLTGIIASFMAQQEDIEKSIISAVYIHGFIADLIVKRESEFGITPNKLIDNFGKTIKFLRKSIV